MAKIKLVLPQEVHANQVIEYREEFLLSGDSIDGSGGLRNCKNFKEWLLKVQNNSSKDTVEQGLVPSSTFLAFDGNNLIGMVDLRHCLNDNLRMVGGHIGYSVRKSERRKGYATEILKSCLEAAKEHGMDRVLVTCDKSNTPSAKTIINNGGVLENEIVDGERVIQRYWISLSVNHKSGFQFMSDESLYDSKIKLTISKCNDAIPEKGWLPAYYFDICLHDGTKVGFCDLRIGHNNKTYIGGNIGYGTHEEYRGNKYAYRACLLMYNLAKSHGMNHIIITCRPDNIASYKTIERARGVLLEICDIPKDNEMYDKGERQVRVYRVDLN